MSDIGHQCTGQADAITIGEVEIRPDLFQAFVRGNSGEFTRREFELLQLLAQAEGKVLQREEIYQAVWGYAMAHGDRSVDVFVRKVRLKLETASPDWSYIHTHFGVGYRFQPERPGGEDASAAFEEELRSPPASASEPTETSAPAEPAVNRIQIKDGKVVGGPADIQVTKGDQVTIVVSANAPDDVHLHGYDIEKPVEPGKPATFKFTADIEGIFEIESHKAEDEGRDPLLGKLTVEPS